MIEASDVYSLAALKLAERALLAVLDTQGDFMPRELNELVTIAANKVSTTIALVA